VYACSFFLPTSALGLDLGLGFFLQAGLGSLRNLGRDSLVNWTIPLRTLSARLLSGPSKGPGAVLSPQVTEAPASGGAVGIEYT